MSRSCVVSASGASAARDAGCACVSRGVDSAAAITTKTSLRATDGVMGSLRGMSASALSGRVCESFTETPHRCLQACAQAVQRLRHLADLVGGLSLDRLV